MWLLGDDGRELARHAQPALGLPQQRHASVRGDAPTVERGGDLLVANGWKREREKAVVSHYRWHIRQLGDQL
jgi:hypothetical protein